MSEQPIEVEALADRAKVAIAALEKKTWSYVELSGLEKDAVNTVFDHGVKHLEKLLPEVAKDIARQRELALIAAGIAKATFPVRKNYTFPSIGGDLGVAWLFPGAIKYATPGPSYPSYTSYKTNSWDIDLTAGTAAHLFGDGNNFYRASPTTNKHSFLLIFENGIVEVGSTPKLLGPWRLISEGKRDYGIYTVEPIVEAPIEKNVAAYQYPTPLGALPISHERGVMWSFMPGITGTSTIKLLGLVFYEHELYPDLTATWIT